MSLVRVTRFDPKVSGCMRALIDLEIDVVLQDEPFTFKLTDCKLMATKEDEQSLWVALPSSQRYVGGSATFYNLIGLADRDQSERFSALVFDALDAFRGT